MNKNQLSKELTALHKKYASIYARREVLKLKSSNRDEVLIEKTQQTLVNLERKITKLKFALDQK